jgi:hypothetical protein
VSNQCVVTPILQPSKGILVLRHAHPATVIGGSGLSGRRHQERGRSASPGALSVWLEDILGNEPIVEQVLHPLSAIALRVPWLWQLGRLCFQACVEGSDARSAWPADERERRLAVLPTWH